MKEVILIIILLAVIVTAGYFIYDNLPGEIQNLNIVYNNTEKPLDISTKSEVSQFEKNMRFNHNSLSYKFVSECPQDKIDKMLEAFSIIHQKTAIIFFYETVKTPDIEITCSSELLEKEKNIFIAGEGGPTKFTNDTIYPLIFQGTILLYKPLYETEDCDEPVVELHELLHVFGFEHLNNSNSIMYPYLSCNQKLDKEFIEYLIELYSIEPKAELKFKEINVTKSGKYLNFNVIVENNGIINASSIILELSSQEKIQDFDFETIEVGSFKRLSVENLKLPSRSTNNITFTIKTPSPEYYTTNNIVSVYASNS